MQACKPGSVSRQRHDSYHLSSPDFAIRIKQPTQSRQPYDYWRAANRINGRDLFGLSTHKVYPACCIAATTVSSYLTISPFPLPI